MQKPAGLDLVTLLLHAFHTLPTAQPPFEQLHALPLLLLRPLTFGFAYSYTVYALLLPHLPSQGLQSNRALTQHYKNKRGYTEMVLFLA